MRNSVFVTLLWGLMGLVLLNISVDTPDPYPQFIPEDLSINDPESIVEIVVEEILGYEDAIKEYDDHDTQDQGKKGNLKIDLLLQLKQDMNNAPSFIHAIKKTIPDYKAGLTSGHHQLETPPPEV